MDESLGNGKAGPKHAYSPWSHEIHQQVLEMRQVRSQRDKFPYALIGAVAIHYELEALKSAETPPARPHHPRLVEQSGPGGSALRQAGKTRP